MWWLAFLLLTISLEGDIILEPNPEQFFNSSANNANRQVYFFLNKGQDGSVFLQVEAPPFYPSDAKYINGGVAYIGVEKVLQTYTKEEVETLTDVDITFTVVANPNPILPEGYQFFGQVYQWGINLDPKAKSYYKLQSANITSQFGINQNLKDYRYNKDNGFLTIYSELLDYNLWLGSTTGAVLSPSLIYPYLVEVKEGNVQQQVQFTIQVDFTKIATLAVGTYSIYFIFGMFPVSLVEEFSKTLQKISDSQVIQVGYLYNTIIGINAYLDGSNALYDPLAADQQILEENKSGLVDIYNNTLDQMDQQWKNYAQMTNLTLTSKKLIASMLKYIAVSKVKAINFNV
jgi:hypothetical protein